MRAASRKTAQSCILYTEKCDRPANCYQLLNLEESSVWMLLLLLTGCLLLLTAIPVIPNLWLVTRSRPQQPTSFISQAAGWIAFLNGPLLGIFLTGFVAILIQQVASNDNRILFGVPALTRGWFTLPLPVRLAQPCDASAPV